MRARGLAASVYPATDGWRWRVIGLNGEILCSGEAYVNRDDCEHVLDLLFGKRTAPIAVTIRNHGGEIVDHYDLPRSLK